MVVDQHFTLSSSFAISLNPNDTIIVMNKTDLCSPLRKITSVQVDGLLAAIMLINNYYNFMLRELLFAGFHVKHLMEWTHFLMF